MKSLTRITVAATVLLASLSTAHAAIQDGPQSVNWQGTDTAGQTIKVPAPDKPTVIAFVRAGQSQSEDVLKQLASAVGNAPAAQVVVIVSGLQAAEQGKLLTNGKTQYPWPVVLDPAFAASGQMGVHVWPTTLVVRPDGSQLAHLAGLPGLFAVHLDAYLQHATGKIDDATLNQRLQERAVVADGAEQKAGRHLRLAEKLLEQGRTDPAAAELEAVLAAKPRDPHLLLALSRALAVAGRPADAVATLDAIPTDAVPAWQRDLVRGRALLALDKWDDARSALDAALKMNPDPSEAYYLLGLIHQHAGDARKAAASFRAAFEHSDAARGKLLTTTPPTK